ncbi:DUF4190 domain-containing protein [Demequina sp. SO4-18]|uniref:DUF4190 domain-containing protein n=1 Tax=Demequina sp. SO4-18 TaxID=3401026 RepID=UPI003B59F2D6
MSTTPDDPFARRPEDGQGQQQQPQGWGDAPPPPPQGQPQSAPQQGQPQYGQPQYAAPPPNAQPQYAQGQYQQPYGVHTGPRPGTEKNWMNITSLVLGIVGLFTWFTAIGGIILGHMGRSAEKKGQADNGGLGLAGLIISYIVMVLGLIALVGFFLFFGWFVSECGGDNPANWCTDGGTSIEIEAFAA